MKASDYVAEVLSKHVGHVFGVQGGAVVHLFDSFAQHGPKPIFCHHEQAAGFSAVSYARIRSFGACVVTTGPAGTNALTACLGAWQDSIPVLFISGQTRAAHCSYGTKERQVGTQEAPILNLVRPITKYAGFVDKPELLRAMLMVAINSATKGRPGPSWLDICVDVQWANL